MKNKTLPSQEKITDTTRRKDAICINESNKTENGIIILNIYLLVLPLESFS